MLRHKHLKAFEPGVGRVYSKATTRMTVKKPHKFAYLMMKTAFLHALYVHFSSFDILKTFSLFLRREMTCFAVVWAT